MLYILVLLFSYIASSPMLVVQSTIYLPILCYCSQSGFFTGHISYRLGLHGRPSHVCDSLMSTVNGGALTVRASSSTKGKNYIYDPNWLGLCVRERERESPSLFTSFALWATNFSHGLSHSFFQKGFASFLNKSDFGCNITPIIHINIILLWQFRLCCVYAVCTPRSIPFISS